MAVDIRLNTRARERARSDRHAAVLGEYVTSDAPHRICQGYCCDAMAAAAADGFWTAAADDDDCFVAVCCSASCCRAVAREDAAPLIRRDCILLQSDLRPLNDYRMLAVVAMESAAGHARARACACFDRCLGAPAHLSACCKSRFMMQ